MKNVGIIYAHMKYILWTFGTFYGHLVILWQFSIFSPILVYCVKKSLATLLGLAHIQREGETHGL
jgi:hypothetical protein